MTKTNTNEPVFLTRAREAGNALATADRNSARGEAFAIYALVSGWNEFEFTYQVSEDEKPVTSRIEHLFSPLLKADASKDGKANAARSAAFAKQFFGMDIVSAAQDAVIRRAMLSARYLVAAGVKPDETCKLIGNTLSIPMGLTLPAPKPDASDKRKAEYNGVKNAMGKLDGKEGLSLSELRKRASEKYPPKTRKPKQSESPVVSFTSSVKMLKAVVSSWNSSEGESNVAPTKELERELFDVQVALATYFAANPIEQPKQQAA